MGRTKSFKSVVILMFTIALFVSCKSTPEKIRELSNNNYFKEASTLIESEEEKVSQSPNLEAIKKLEAAKKVFEERLFSFAKETTDKLALEGKIREASSDALDYSTLCPWSDRIGDLARFYMNKEAIIEGIEDKWQTEIDSRSIDLSKSREALQDLSAVRNAISDSPKLQKLLEIARKGCVDYWAQEIASKDTTFEIQYITALTNDFNLLQIDGSKTARLIDAIRKTISLIHTSTLNGEKNGEVDADVVFLTLYDKSDLVFDDKTIAIQTTLQRLFEKWLLGDYLVIMKSRNVTYTMINQSEALLNGIELLTTNSAFKDALAVAHLNRARQLIKGGICTVLSFPHIERAKQLSTEQIDAIAALDSQARAYLGTVRYPSFKLSIDINPSISLDVQGIIYSAFSNSFLGRSKEDRPWQIVPPDSTNQDVSLSIENAEVAFGDLGNLGTQVSQYLSHYESVPNPQKEILEGEVSFAKSQIQWSKDRYDSAVSSYNIDPTDWALSEANSAYNDYSMAVDRYNLLVTSYNLTPSTIQQPVFLPYAFQQGNVSFGFGLRVKCIIGPREQSFSSQSMDTGFVRIGTKATDVNPSYRRDQFPKFSVTVDRLLEHLNDSVDNLCDQIEPLLLDLNYPTYIPLSNDETRMAKIMLHPWGVGHGVVVASDLPQWAKNSVQAVRIADLSLDLPKLDLSESKLKTVGPLQTEKAVDTFEPIVPMIESLSDDRTVSIGTGTLIGPEGLILTCAHVLNSQKIIVEFAVGPNQGKYDTVIVFSNERRDVALIRAKNLSNMYWAHVRLTGDSIRGERILAIGNPAINESTVSIGGASLGIVSNPTITLFGQDHLVADITVASGSSGGPLFSLKDGELIGVVQAVTTPGIKEEGVSSSGSYCLAAPANELGNWLGLRYKN